MIVYLCLDKLDSNSLTLVIEATFNFYYQVYKEDVEILLTKEKRDIRLLITDINKSDIITVFSGHKIPRLSKKVIMIKSISSNLNKPLLVFKLGVKEG